MTDERRHPTEVVVVGGGLAGWTAACRAQELGRRVTLVERAHRAPGWGNSLVSGGALHAAQGDPVASPDALVRRMQALTDGCCRDDVVEAWAANAPRSIAWIREHGGTVAPDPPGDYRAAVFWPVRALRPGLPWRGFGVDRYLRGLRGSFLNGGGTLFSGARARHLKRTPAGWRVSGDGRFVGHTLDAQAVILADGGFQANRALLRRYIGTDQVKLRATGSGIGDALLMGLGVGAKAVNMNAFYGHPLVRDALSRRNLWPYPVLDALTSAGVVVDRRGRRCVDEGQGGVAVANGLAWSANPLDFWVLFDDDAWNTAGRETPIPPNPYLEREGATIVRAPSLDAVAHRARIDVDGLRRSLRHGGATPVHTGKPALSRPPFYAIPLVAGVTFTMGGLLVDGSARVLDADEKPIPGLMAAGGTMGGLHGGPRAGYAGGLLEAAVFGLLAGESAGRGSNDPTGALRKVG